MFIENIIEIASQTTHSFLKSLKHYAFDLALFIAKFLQVFQGDAEDLAQRLDESAVLDLFAATMEQQAEGSWIFSPAFLDAEEDVSGHHDGRVGDEGIEVPALAAFLQFQMLLGRAEEYLDVPAACRKCGQRLHRQG